MEELVIHYFHKDFIYEDIKLLLQKEHGITTSVSTIKRVLKDNNLRRKRIIEDSVEVIVTAILEELYSSGFNLGYRSMWKKLKKNYDLKVTRNTVYLLLQLIDPEGIEERYGNRLRRREYLSPGPNFIWHLDGYDKLKQFGFAIHGCIDGFSRMLLWLEVANTNNNPKVVSFYYLKTLKEMQLIPTMIRSDKGSENVLIEDLQICLRSFHDDELKGEKSFIKGKSTHNQRIESFWGQLRKHTIDFYIQLFKSLQSDNLFDGSTLDKMCLQYAFGPLLKVDLRSAKDLWNEHDIRRQALRNNLSGKPCIMYKLPEKYGARDFKKEVDSATIDRLIDRFAEVPVLVDPLIKQFVKELDLENNICCSPEEALDFYKKIRLAAHVHDIEQ